MIVGSWKLGEGSFFEVNKTKCDLLRCFVGNLTVIDLILYGFD
jgi:hypothetical protein